MRFQRIFILLMSFITLAISSGRPVRAESSDVVAGAETSAQATDPEKQKDLLVYQIMVLGGVFTWIETFVKAAPESFYAGVFPNTSVNGVDISNPEFKKRVTAAYNSRTPALIEKLKAQFTAYYKERYTQEELQALLKFSLSSAGRKYRDDGEGRGTRLTSILAQAFAEFSGQVQKDIQKKK